MFRVPFSSFKAVIAIAVIVAGTGLLAGCTKKKEPALQSSLSNLANTPKTDTVQKADSGDVFDEFYSGDEQKKKQSAAGSKQDELRAVEAVSFDENGRFVVQISCVANSGLADNVSGRLKSKGYPAYVAEVQNPTPSLTGTYYRVRIGNFSRVATAKSFAEQNLVPAGYEFWVDNKSNDNVGVSGSGFGAQGASGYESSPTGSTEATAGSASSSTWTSTPPPSAAPGVESSTMFPATDTAATAGASPAPAPEAAPQAATPPPDVAPAPAATQPASSGSDDWGSAGWGSDTSKKQ